MKPPSPRQIATHAAAVLVALVLGLLIGRGIWHLDVEQKLRAELEAKRKIFREETEKDMRQLRARAREVQRELDEENRRKAELGRADARPPE